MDIKAIQELLKLINKSSLTDVEIEQKDFKIRIQRRQPEAGNVTYAMVQPQVQPMAAAPAATPAAAPAPAAPAAQPEPAAEPAAQSKPASNLIEFKSPIIGTFYRSSGPDKEPYIKVGDTVSKGQVLCIVEAMKLFNEIESEYDGKIVKILAEDAQPVEYEQPLFLIEPV